MLLNACRVDHVQFVLLAIEDVTERRRSQEDQQLLLRELTHRVKNALLTAQTIALQSARQARSLDEFVTGFEGRLSSMAKAYDLLSRRRWEGVDLRQLLDVELTPYCESDGPRRQLAGPPVHLNAESALSIQLVLHELATNAAKYGALSVPAGRLRVRWDIEDGDNPTLWIRWAERGGPPVTPPAEVGFGTQLVKLTIEYDLRGEYEPTYASRGFRCEITVPWEKEPREPGSRRFEPEPTP